MRLASCGMICFDGKIIQPVIGKGIDLYQAGLINYYAMLRLRSDMSDGASHDVRVEAAEKLRNEVER